MLAKAPHADPKSRDVKEVAWSLREALQARLAAEEKTATDARARAAEARDRVGLFGRLGLPTRERREADRLAAVAEDAERQAELARGEYPREARDDDARAPHVVRAREKEREAWERKSDVRSARREEHANDLIERAVTTGDREIEELAARDLRQAQEEVLRREQEEQRRREEELQQRQAMEAAREVAQAAQKLGGAGPCPPSPR